MLQTTEIHSLGVCGSLCGEKHLLLIFISFYWFDQKQLFKQIQIFLRISQFSNMVRKTNFLSISVLVSEIVTFLTKKISSLWTSPKMLQNNRKAQFSCMWLNLGRKTVYVNFCPLLQVWSKTVVYTNPNFSQDLPLSNMVRKQNFPSISVLVSEIVTFMSKKRRPLLISPKMLQINRKA